MVSNCKSKYRNLLLEKLFKLVKFPDGTPAVDVYGACKRNFPKTPYRDIRIDQAHKNSYSMDGIEPHLALKYYSEYKFYLSFENSRCTDYITEKFFTSGLLAGTVPIVAGPDRNTYERFAPKDSFIHVDDFKNISSLAEEINYYLDAKKFENYNGRFFSWRNNDSRKENYSYQTLDSFQNSGLCKLCNIAEKIKNGESLKMDALSGLHNWWYNSGHNGTSTCHTRRKKRDLTINDLLFI